ncbi:MAG: hypothetical protein DRI69_07815 [Bacteroidetes bacterium]|nr:MAG: hypothetical protein DRI69_07815 [Bacteroidota bacterium]
MTISNSTLVLGILLGMPLMSISQNIGVGTSAPSEALEVQGKVFSNQGGFKFPDGTVQTTAAMMADPETEAVTNLFGVIEIDGVIGGYDNPPITDAIKVLGFDFSSNRTFEIGGGGGASIPSLPIVKVLLEVEKSTTQLFDKYVNGSPIQVILIHLLDDTGSPYFTVGMEEVIIISYEMQLVHIGNGEYAHLLALSFNPEKLSTKNIDETACYCWNWVTNNDCSCID